MQIKPGAVVIGRDYGSKGLNFDPLLSLMAFRCAMILKRGGIKHI